MLDDLEALADDIAALAALCEEADGLEARILLAQLTQHLRTALEALMDRSDMLTGTSPWWKRMRDHRP